MPLLSDVIVHGISEAGGQLLRQLLCLSAWHARMHGIMASTHDAFCQVAAGLIVHVLRL